VQGLRREGGDVVLLVAHLEPEVADAALQDGVGGRHSEAARGCRGGPRRVRRPTAPGGS
jgi:hypothetical protein